MKFILTRCSWHVRRRALHPRFRHTLLHHRRFITNGRACISKRTTHHDLSLQRTLVRRLAHSSRRIIWHPKPERRLGLAHTFATPSRPITTPNRLHLVPASFPLLPKSQQANLPSMIPESPRFLISKDRREEAYATLITYHAEGATTSPFAAAEMAQIEHTIRIELEHSKRSWREMIAVPGLRKRVIIGSFLGLFTQWSGNTLLSYYLNQLLNMIGYDDPGFVGKVNVGLNSWNLVNAVCISLLVRRFPRRKMYLICASSLLCCYVAWTVAMQRYTATKRIEPARLTIAIIFLYQMCYNIGYNALTYSKSVGACLMGKGMLMESQLFWSSCSHLRSARKGLLSSSFLAGQRFSRQRYLTRSG